MKCGKILIVFLKINYGFLIFFFRDEPLVFSLKPVPGPLA
jgi:hypothetical protein